MDMLSPGIFPTPKRIAELEQLGDQIAELSAHLEAGTARPLDVVWAIDLLHPLAARLPPWLGRAGGPPVTG